MAIQLDQNVKDDLKTQFVTREGTYRLMTLPEYSRPNRVGYTNSQSSPQVRVSIVSLPNPPGGNSGGGGGGDGSYQLQQRQNSNSINTGTISSLDSRLSGGGGGNVASNSQLHYHLNNTTSGIGGGVGLDQNGQHFYGGDRICFNFGKELYVYSFRGVKKGSELSKPIDKKLYKGTNPSCHDFNSINANPDSAPLLVGFTTGQIQLIQPGRREPGKLYNEERLIDKTKVTCLKWLPGSPNLFLASHASGHLYLYNEELPCSPTVPNYQPFKMGDGYTILTCKSKSTRNPLYKWVFTTDNCSINEFSFSPCGTNLALVSQDGFLRVFHYDTMELLGIARSYFGGFLCVCWSPDGKYIVVGGEDDLVTVWSLHERRVVARGQGHRSWVSVVAFDPYTTAYTNWDGGPDFSDDETGTNLNDYQHHRFYNGDDGGGGGDSNSTETAAGGSAKAKRPCRNSFQMNKDEKLAISYRLGSVSQDTQLCLWDITEDVLRHPLTLRQRGESNCADTASDSGIGTIGETGTSISDGSNILHGGHLPNGDINEIKIIKPISIQNNSNSNKNNNSSSNSSSKFSTTTTSSNCTTASSLETNTTTGHNNISSNSSNNKNNSNLIKLTNCINSTKSPSIETPPSMKSSGKSSSESSSGSVSAFNSITQRISNFSFGNDKTKSERSSNHNRKAFSLSKSSGSYHTTNLLQNDLGISGSSSGSTSGGNNKIKNMPNTITSYDPMKLIGTPACPRFDECPLLEPLICKKIAHERLTALIFREDCFLTACQDGFIYTWARPGYSNVPHNHNSNAPTGGTVV